jgi:hypothetical protein
METLVIRLWVPAPGEEPAAGENASVLRGVLEHPASGSSQPFTDRAELLRLLEDRARTRHAGTGTGKGADSTPSSSIRAE